MYAHKVIDDMEQIFVPELKKIKTDFLEVLIDNIKDSQNFNLPEFDSVDKSKVYDTILRYRMDGFQMPYEKCWFDFNCCHNNKELVRAGVSAMKLDNGNISYSVFTWGHEVKKWTPSLVSTVINPDTCKYSHIGNFDRVAKDVEYVKENGEQNSNIILHVLQCLEILNCKNINTETIKPNSKINNKRVKKGRQKLFEYKTIVLKPTSKKQKQQEQKGLWDNRVHLCRGHFKEYTEDKPLFGRVTGRFWWQPMARGNSKNGIIKKDYILKKGDAM